MNQVSDSGRWGALALLSVSITLGISLWLSGSAAAPQLQVVYGISSSQAAWLTTMVQIGFVVGTALAALLNLADVVPSRYYFSISATLGAAANALLLVLPGFGGALLTRFLVGLFLAGVYPPAMKMISTWFQSGRGFAIGTLVGALTLGKAGPFLIHSIGTVSVTVIILAASISALVAAALVGVLYRDGPYPFPRRPFSWSLASVVFRQREWRLATGGYLGHMWELYAFWTWITAFFVASAQLRQDAGLIAPGRSISELIAFCAIAVGALGAAGGGWLADRIGQERLVIWAMAISGSCALFIGLAFGGSIWILAPVALVWGIAVVADSAQFSTMVTRSVPQHAVGTALTLQTSLGFLLTTATIQMIPPAVDAIGWRWAFSLLSIGPALGIVAIVRLLSYSGRSTGGASR